MRKYPHLIEINAVLFLRRLSEKYGKKLTLASIPQQEWEHIAKQGFDFVWLMGVWKRSPGARQRALSSPELLKECRAVLPDFKNEDMIGSAYAVYGYELDPSLGQESDFLKLRENLHQAGLKLILDYVPNHLALDHPWTLEHPEWFVGGSQEDFLKSQDLFFKTEHGDFLAHGRDPYFPPWNDTVQINYFSKGARDAASEILLKIARVADGVRCDMAMLAFSWIFEKTWHGYLEKTPKPKAEFWTEVIGKVRGENSEFVFMAEAYWDLEWELQQVGFDYTYDKKFYDKLLQGTAEEVQAHLRADMEYQQKLMRFIENHDEARAASAFGGEKSRAAALVAASVPGVFFFFDGQAEGKKIKLPIQLRREPKENPDTATQQFYEFLFSFTSQKTLREGTFRFLETKGWKDNGSHENLLAWAWQLGREVRMIVMNYSEDPAQGQISLQSDWLKADVLLLKDVLNGENYERNSQELQRQGLHVELGPWKAHCFEISV